MAVTPPPCPQSGSQSNTHHSTSLTSGPNKPQWTPAAYEVSGPEANRLSHVPTRPSRAGPATPGSSGPSPFQISFRQWARGKTESWCNRAAWPSEPLRTQLHGPQNPKNTAGLRALQVESHSTHSLLPTLAATSAHPAQPRPVQLSPVQSSPSQPSSAQPSSTQVSPAQPRSA